MKSKKEKGIALIITIMLSAIMLTTVFVASREMVEEAKNSTRIDNSLIAYYAAESGLEDALLQYRYDKNSELVDTKTKCVNLDKESATIPTGECNDGWSPTSGPYSTNPFLDRFYKVKMWYKVDPSINPIESLTLNKDDILELSIPESNTAISFNWDVVPGSITADSTMMVEITTYDKNNPNVIDKQLVDTNSVKTFTSSNGPDKIIRIKPWLAKKTGITMVGGSETSGSIPGIIISGISKNGAGKIGGPTTFVESIGYFGGVQRKIAANIDRSSGQILNIMDFVIYSGSDLIK